MGAKFEDASGRSSSPISLAGDSVSSKNGRPLLIGGRCNECGALAFPRVSVCSTCMSESFADEPMPERGTLYSWTAVHVGQPRMHKPITLGYVDLENGVRVFSHLCANDRQLCIDQRMRLTVGQVGIEASGRPIETFVFMPAGDEK